jgi:hypothetical protein
VLFGSEREEILSGVMKPSPNSVEWNSLYLRDLLA